MPPPMTAMEVSVRAMVHRSDFVTSNADSHRLGYSRLAQALAKMRHRFLFSEQMGVTDEGEREVRPLARHLLQVTSCLVMTPQLPERRDQHRVARPLEVRLAERLEREADRAFVVAHEV